MKCPVCKGNKYIQEFDNRGLRQYQCRTCGGTGESICPDCGDMKDQGFKPDAYMVCETCGGE